MKYLIIPFNLKKKKVRDLTEEISKLDDDLLVQSKRFRLDEKRLLTHKEILLRETDAVDKELARIRRSWNDTCGSTSDKRKQICTRLNLTARLEPVDLPPQPTTIEAKMYRPVGDVHCKLSDDEESLNFATDSDEYDDNVTKI